LLLKAVDVIPGLKAKVEQAGGIDKFVSGRRSSAPPQAGPIQPGGGSTDIRRGDNADSLFEELRGKAEKNAGYVRARLSNVAQDPQHIDMLLTLAGMATYEDPELGSMALDAATSLLAKIEPLEKRADLMESIARLYRDCDGEANQDLLREGFLLVDQLRHENQIPRSTNAPIESQADAFEVFLLSELARENFEASMKYVRGMQDKNLRIMSFLKIAESLRESGMN
jgi:hypothetical protein